MAIHKSANGFVKAHDIGAPSAWTQTRDGVTTDSRVTYEGEESVYTTDTGRRDADAPGNDGKWGWFGLSGDGKERKEKQTDASDRAGSPRSPGVTEDDPRTSGTSARVAANGGDGSVGDAVDGTADDTVDGTAAGHGDDEEGIEAKAAEDADETKTKVAAGVAAVVAVGAVAAAAANEANDDEEIASSNERAHQARPVRKVGSIKEKWKKLKSGKDDANGNNKNAG